MQVNTYNGKIRQILAEHYRQDYDLIKSRYEYNPWEDASVDRRIEWLDSVDHLKADRHELIRVLKAFNKKINNTSLTMSNIEFLKDKQTVVVIGGQQAGLFTGPLLVIYKAITLIQLAKLESKRLSRKVIPVFWIAGEDHDYDEVNHIDFLSQQQNIERIKLLKHSDVRSSISEQFFSIEEWHQVINQLDESLINTEFKHDIIQKLKNFTDQSRSLTDFFASIMAWLFGQYGLILMDSADPHLRQIESEMFDELINQHQTINTALIKGSEQLSTLGYEIQAEVRKGQMNLFINHEGNRILLNEVDGGFSDRKEEVFFSKLELLEIARKNPQRLSNNVFTRPLMQEFLFPVLHSVLGSGEIAYWGLIKEAFHQLGMRMPIIVPRQEYTLLEGTIQKHMSKFELSFADVILHFDEKKNAWLETQDQLNINQKFVQVKKQFEEIYGPLIVSLSEVHSGIGKLGETNKQKIVEQIDFLHKRAMDALLTQNESSMRQFDRIYLAILPLGKPQERVYNIFNYLNKYGTDWLDDLVQLSISDRRKHFIIYF